MTAYIWLIPVLPLLVFLFLIGFGSRLKQAAGYLASLAVAVSFVLSLYVLAEQWMMAGSFVRQVSWLTAGETTFSVGLEVNRLNALMLGIVSFVSLLVHIYSLGYMQGDERYGTYFAYLALFTFSMLGLVISPNLLQTYIFWELVGLSSFLLIGFWYFKPEAREAAKKAFLMTRVGDVALFAGMILLFWQVGSFQFSEIFAAVDAGKIPSGMVTLTAILIFIGAMGKSGQFPLHTWLPDAMEGPTPVSALIHAATMVAAGVYLVARTYPLFEASETALLVVAAVGGFTAIFAASIGLVQTDIKRVLAYSTVSQLGYMMLALGAAGYTAAVFHLGTHAFFKALLFLAAGAVIHALHTQDIREMGGLWRKMPLTGWVFLIGALAISGIPPFAGYFSKEEILLATWESGHPFLFWLALAAVFFTSFYMFRLYFMVFAGAPQKEGLIRPIGREMSVPMIILAILSVVAGWVNTPWSHSLASWLSADQLTASYAAPAFNGWITVLSVLLALGGIGLAFLMYYREALSPARLADRFSAVYQVLLNKYWIDELYRVTVVWLAVQMGRLLQWIDRWIISGLVALAGMLAAGVGRLGAGLQTGQVQTAHLVSVVGLVVLLLILTLGGVWL
jgi:NADH-quinone oxidoreductase subunit L